MSRCRLRRLRRLLLLAAIALASLGAIAQSAGGNYRVRKSVIAAGSATLQAGPYRATATAGQPEPGTLSGGDLRVQGGFWPAPPPTAAPDPLFADGFEN